MVQDVTLFFIHLFLVGGGYIILKANLDYVPPDVEYREVVCSVCFNVFCLYCVSVLCTFCVCCVFYACNPTNPPTTNQCVPSHQTQPTKVIFLNVLKRMGIKKTKQKKVNQNKQTWYNQIIKQANEEANKATQQTHKQQVYGVAFAQKRNDAKFTRDSMKQVVTKIDKISDDVVRDMILANITLKY